MKLSEFLDNSYNPFFLNEKRESEEEPEIAIERTIKGKKALKAFIDGLVFFSIEARQVISLFKKLPADVKRDIYYAILRWIFFIVSLYRKSITTYAGIGLEVEKYFAEVLGGEKNPFTAAKADIIVYREGNKGKIEKEGISLKFYRITTSSLSLGSISGLRDIFEKYFNKIIQSKKVKITSNQEGFFFSKISQGNLSASVLQQFRNFLNHTDLLKDFYKEVKRKIRDLYGKEDWIVAFHNGIEKIKVSEKGYTYEKEVPISDLKNYYIVFIIFGDKTFYDFVFDDLFFSENVSFARWNLKTSKNTLIDFVKKRAKRGDKIIKVEFGKILEAKDFLAEIFQINIDYFKSLMKFNEYLPKLMTDIINAAMQGNDKIFKQKFEELVKELVTGFASILKNIKTFVETVETKDKETKLKQEKIKEGINDILKITDKLQALTEDSQLLNEINIEFLRKMATFLRNLFLKIKNYIFDISQKIRFIISNKNKLSPSKFLDITEKIISNYKFIIENLYKLKKEKINLKETLMEEQIIAEKRKYTKKNLSYWTWKIKQRKKKRKPKAKTIVVSTDKEIGQRFSSLFEPNPAQERLKKLLKKLRKKGVKGTL